MKRWLLTAVILALSSNAIAATVTINFDDVGLSSDGDPIDNHYSALGVTFSNAEWNDRFDTRPGTTSLFQITSVADGEFPKSSNPLIAVFDGIVDMVSISAIDVGFNDSRIDAYDAVVGGNLIGFDVYEGLTEFGNSLGLGDTSILTIAVAGIRRIELYQPKSDSTADGTGWDNLEYSISPVPVPAAIWLFGTALIGLVGFSKRRKPA